MLSRTVYIMLLVYGQNGTYYYVEFFFQAVSLGKGQQN